MIYDTKKYFATFFGNLVQKLTENMAEYKNKNSKW